MVGAHIFSKSDPEYISSPPPLPQTDPAVAGAGPLVKASEIGNPMTGGENWMDQPCGRRRGIAFTMTQSASRRFYGRGGHRGDSSDLCVDRESIR